VNRSAIQLLWVFGGDRGESGRRCRREFLSVRWDYSRSKRRTR